MTERWVYVTFANEEQASTIARHLVTERLAACANVLGSVRSFYWWEGAVQDDCECAAVFKTTDSALTRFTERVLELHTYAVPCVVALPIAGGNPDFLRWVREQTAG